MDRTLNPYRYAEMAAAAAGTEWSPLPYQRRLATEAWPDALIVPTGLGKTAAVILAWLYRLRECDPETPRRLVYCLPMRVLVDQVAQSAETWLNNLKTEPTGSRGAESPAIHRLLGGASDRSWTDDPARPALIVGTQDMLLSRALMRGYGMSRYRWAEDFALLHADALWVFDEVQLMGAGLPTSTQLEAFRRELGTARPCRSLWLSATLRPDWLGSVDFRRHIPAGGLTVAELEEEDRAHPLAAGRLGAAKRLARADTRLTGLGKAALNTYSAGLAAEAARLHRPGQTTLIVVNRVDRAQAVFKAVRQAGLPALLVHSRFRQADRQERNKAIGGEPPDPGRVVVATQAIEAGVDLTSAVLLTELAPWASLVQRFGRCNRYGECPEGAEVRWIDIAAGKDAEKLAPPYDAEALERVRAILEPLQSAASADLPPISDPPAAGQVLRHKDLLELFNTEPDLSGFDIDVSPYIRDAGDTDLQVFWRAGAAEAPEAQPLPDAAELCPVSIAAFRAFFDDRRKALRDRPLFFALDPLARVQRGRSVPWIALDRPRPGLTVMVDADAGGYGADLGFDPTVKTAVEAMQPQGPRPDTPDEDPGSLQPFIGLTEHLAHVAAAAQALCEDLGEGAGGGAVVRAARWHDVGKAHEEFQKRLTYGLSEPPTIDGPLAKSPLRQIRYDRKHFRRFFRHELASALAFLANAKPRDTEADPDLVAYLIAAHHGKVRTIIRALPEETEPKNRSQRFARGVWDGDPLPKLDIPGEGPMPETALSLAVMELGRGPEGPSWAERVHGLLSELGPFRLAWLEALVRLADRRASRAETESPGDD